MPITAFQKHVLALLTGHRSEASHLAGATALGLSPESSRYSHDLDYFHDSEVDVAESYALDRTVLEDAGIRVELRAAWKDALAEAGTFVDSRPSDEAGCFYVDRETGCFVAPEGNRPVELHRAAKGGILPAVEGLGAQRPDDLTKRFFAIEPSVRKGSASGE